MSYTTGNKFRLTCYGASHAKCIGGVIEGIPAGTRIDFDAVQRFADRRRPGTNAFSTRRKESDIALVTSGIEGGTATGTPISFVIENTDARSPSSVPRVPRPMHADFPAYVRYGDAFDARGGGQFSGRMTALMCFAGGIAKQLLERRGITVGAHALSVGSVYDDAFDRVNVTAEELLALGEKPFPVINPDAEKRMLEAISDASKDGDSVGGIVECAVTGMPVGVGEPIFDSVESRISHLLFSIPAVKGVDFGAGFAASQMRGSEHNDGYTVRDGKIVTLMNNHGGILGGLTTGMPILFRMAVKPTPTVSVAQKSVDMDTMTDTELKSEGRNDPCIVMRAVPCAEAAAAMALYDLLSEYGE